MIINNLNQADENHVLNGNAEDVCVLCAYEMAKNEGKTLSQADRCKYEVARELGLLEKLTQVGWAGLSTAESGRIGGLIGARRRKE